MIGNTTKLRYTKLYKFVDMLNMTPTSTLLPSHPFWNFSLLIYEQELTQQALLALQNKHGLNINMLLFCCWYAATNQGQLNKQEIKQLLTTIHTWHERIVMQLRFIRDQLKNSSTAAWANAIRQEILSAELMGEHIEQLLLTDCHSKKPSRSRRSHQQQAVNACQNMLSYCTILFISLDQHDCALIAHLLKSCFPELNNVEINNFCKAILLNKPILSKPAQKQLKLQLHS